MAQGNRRIDKVLAGANFPFVCANLIRGKAGTKVRLELINVERNETNTVELTRQKFSLPK